MKKVIHINCHSLPLSDDYVYDSFPSRMALNVHKYSKNYINECWYAINNIKEEQLWKKNGIVYRLFPAFTLNSGLESFFGIVFSDLMMKALLHEKKCFKNIYHIQGERGLLVWSIINIVKGDPIIIQFHGYRGVWFLRPIEKLFIETGEKYFYKYVKYFLVHFKKRVRYLTDICRIPLKQIIYQNLGVDYNIFKPVDKFDSRKLLSLPNNKKIILYVGLGVKNKGLNKIIEAHQFLKNKYNTFLLLIGVSKNHPLYDLSKNNADLLLDRIDHSLMPKYYSSADVCCMLCPIDKRDYGGLGIAAMEALACNTPIINSNISDAPDQIINKIGLGASNVSELIDGLINIFDKRVNLGNTRDVSKSFFSWKNITKNILRLYDSFDLK
jgi:glycosyltransferase involved in cell wall biosynthesis